MEARVKRKVRKRNKTKRMGNSINIMLSILFTIVTCRLITELHISVENGINFLDIMAFGSTSLLASKFLLDYIKGLD